MLKIEENLIAITHDILTKLKALKQPLQHDTLIKIKANHSLQKLLEDFLIYDNINYKNCHYSNYILDKIPEWDDFIKELQQNLHIAKAKNKQKYLITEIMPSQRVLNWLTAESLNLTEFNSNNANINTLLTYYYKMAIQAKMLAYNYIKLPCYQTKDKFLSNINNNERKRLYTDYIKKIKNPLFFDLSIIKPSNLNSLIDDWAHYNEHNNESTQYLLLIKYFKCLAIALINNEQSKKITSWGQLPKKLKRDLSIEFSYIFCKKELFLSLNNNLKFKKETLNKYSLQKYIIYNWQRKQPLTTVSQGETILVKAQGSLEISKITVNNLPYRKQHLLSLSGCKANNSSIILCNMRKDFEKIIQDAIFCNYLGNIKHLKKIKTYDVFQNPRAVSSIKESQHLHLGQYSIKDYKFFNINSNPKFIKQLNAYIDLIPIGLKNKEIVLLKLTSCFDKQSTIIEFFNKLKNSLQIAYHDYNNIDFYFHVIPDGQGKLVCILIPLSPINIVDNLCHNLDSNEKFPIIGDFHIIKQPAHKIKLLDENGEEHIRKYFDFIYKPQAHNVIYQHVNKYGF